MIKFKQFLNEEKENEAKKKIFEIVDAMTSDEKFEFGYWLQDTFFTDDEGDDIDIDDIEDEFDIVHFSTEFIKEMIDELPSEIYPDILADLEETEEDYEDDESEEDYEDDESEEDYEDEMDESVSRIMKVQNVNRKKRKFMAKSKAQLRREVSKRKKENRLNRNKRRRFYKANKQKILNYQKSRKGFMEKGSHFKKLRRQG